jgi:hypothetical protein
VTGVVAALVILAVSAGHVDSGVEGLVTIGPTCPVERYPPDPSCADRPYATTLKIVRARSHAFVKRFESRSDGRFRVHLVRGRYLIEQTGTASLPRLAPVAVTVHSDRFTRVNLMFDSGIR